MPGRAFSGVLALAAVASLVAPVALASASGGESAPDRQHVVLAPAPGSVVPGLSTGWLRVPDLGGGAHRVRVGVVPARGEHVADVLFVHGHADRLDNHAALFADYARAGVRVVSFDLPSHGLTEAGPIDVWSIADLAELAARVERATRDGADVPLVVSGWSFGGLVATRIAQRADLLGGFDRPVAGLALEVPALVPYPAAGGDGISRLRALTHDLRAPVAGPPRPASPLLDPVFAARLLAEAEVARSRPLPSGIPALVELSDPRDDLYVDSAAVADWARGEARSAGADVTVRTCEGARHGIDLEAYPVGPSARQTLVEFVLASAAGRPLDPAENGAPCR